MRNELTLLAVLLASLAASGCQNMPVVEICVTGDAGLICHDSRKPKGQQDYTRHENNDICTNSADFNAIVQWGHSGRTGD